MSTDEHPAVAVRRQALARLRRQFPDRCEADREDAVHEAMCAALRVGKAGNRRVVCGWAARRLLGTVRVRGEVRPSRSPATSIACGTLPLALEHEPGTCAVDPCAWLDAAPEVARVVDFDAVLDAVAAERRRREEAAAAERRRRERAEAIERARQAEVDARRARDEVRARAATEARRLVPLAAAACGGLPALARALGVPPSTPYRWRDPRTLAAPRPEVMDRLRVLAHAHCTPS